MLKSFFLIQKSIRWIFLRFVASWVELKINMQINMQADKHVELKINMQRRSEPDQAIR